MEVIQDMTETERNDAKMAVLFELRLLIKADEKENYTKAEVLDLLDTAAQVKETK